MTRRNSIASRPPSKPAKPSADFPLFPLWNGKVGRWAKKIRGKLVYFGSWDDGADAALQRYLDQKDALHAGRTPDTEELTILRLTVAFLKTKKAMHKSGELSVHSLNDYMTTSKRLVKAFGKDRLAADLRPDDFEKLRTKLSKAWGPVRVGNEINRVRVLFNYGVKSGILEKVPVYGEGFRRPSKKTLRKHRAEQGPKMFEAAEVRAMLDAAGQPLKAMIMLGVNCGFGNSDVGALPLSALDLGAAWINYPRPKTGIARRCPLWPVTVQALREWLAVRPKAKRDDHADLVFVTAKGDSWAKETSDNPVSKETRKLLDRLGIHVHRNFYALRHTLQTIGDEARDFLAVRHIMGHVGADIADEYREKVSDDRLRAVADHVRAWLFTKSTKATKPKAKGNPSNLRVYAGY